MAPLSPDDINIPAQSADVVLVNALNTTYLIAGIIAVITIVVAGIMFATSAGDPGNVTKAKNLMLFSIVGLVVVIIAFAITSFVAGVF